jgi:hypothetical protein
MGPGPITKHRTYRIKLNKNSVINNKQNIERNVLTLEIFTTLGNKHNKAAATYNRAKWDHSFLTSSSYKASCP